MPRHRHHRFPRAARPARRRIRAAGLAERVSIELRDYRDVTGRFERIASIEMLEAVGERNWPVFFGKLRGGLAAGGRAALQVITIDDRSSSAAAAEPISSSAISSRAASCPRARPWCARPWYARSAMPVSPGWATRISGATTPIPWRPGGAASRAARDRVEAPGYPDRFRRMWDFHLAYCEAGLRIARTDLPRISLGRPG